MGDKKDEFGPSQFGKTFTKHMLKIYYDEDLGGWQDPQIVLFENIVLHPAAKVLHYANEVFEGMKAYKGVDGQIRLFRPMENLKRLNRSCERAVLPQVDVDLLLKYLKKFVFLDRESFPEIKGGCFYVRPTVISTDPDVSMQRGRKALLFIILSPVGPYFGSGFTPIRVSVISKFVRSWPGGTGEFKMGGNYTSIMYVNNLVKKDNCQMVLWSTGEDQQLSEAGVMNLFMFYINKKGEKQLATPPLDGTILPGITRLSILQLTREWKEFNVVEELITLGEVRLLLRENRLLELMGVGTAAVVCPISELFNEGEIVKLPTMDQEQPLFKRLYESMSDIQYGKTSHPWAEIIHPDILNE